MNGTVSRTRTVRVHFILNTGTGILATRHTAEEREQPREKPLHTFLPPGAARNLPTPTRQRFTAVRFIWPVLPPICPIIICRIFWMISTPNTRTGLIWRGNCCVAAMSLLFTGEEVDEAVKMILLQRAAPRHCLATTLTVFWKSGARPWGGCWYPTGWCASCCIGWWCHLKRSPFPLPLSPESEEWPNAGRMERKAAAISVKSGKLTADPLKKRHNQSPCLKMEKARKKPENLSGQNRVWSTLSARARVFPNIEVTDGNIKSFWTCGPEIWRGFCAEKGHNKPAAPLFRCSSSQRTRTRWLPPLAEYTPARLVKRQA